MGMRDYFILTAISVVWAAVYASEECDFFSGRWEIDEEYPLYNSSACPFIEREFGCQKNGRPDSLYTKYAWKPLACDLQRYIHICPICCPFPLASFFSLIVTVRAGSNTSSLFTCSSPLFNEKSNAFLCLEFSVHKILM